MSSKNNNEKKLVDSIQDNSVNISGGKVDNVVGGSNNKQVNSVIQSDTLEVEKLLLEMENLLKKPNDNNPDLQELLEAFSRYKLEVAKEKPNRKWYEITAENVKTTAKNVESIAMPILNTVEKITKLLDFTS